MGLRQKSRGIRLGFWENLALILMAVTLLSAFGWWYTRATQHWETVPARVTGLSLIENQHRFSAARPQVRLHYRYVVQGRVLFGKTPLDAATRTRYQALPEEVRRLLRGKGYMSFKDLPPAMQSILRRRGIERFDRVPKALLDTLRAQGYHGVQDFPDDVRRMVGDGEFAKAARTMEHRIEVAPGPNGTPAVLPANGSRIREPLAPLGDGGLILLRVNPDAPEMHEVLRYPRLDGWAGATLFLVSAGISVGYCGFVYPRAKRHSGAYH